MSNLNVEFYSTSEIKFIDRLLAYSECDDVNSLNVSLDNIKNFDWFDKEDLLQLRLKGIIEVRKVSIPKTKFEGSLEEVSFYESDHLSIDEENLIRTWVNSVYYLAAESISQKIDILKKDGYFYIEIDVDTDSKIQIKFIVNENFSETNGLFISFINNINQKLFEEVIYWDEPIANQSSANAFFQHLKQQGKLLSNRNFNYINIPPHLESTELEGFKSVIKTYLEKLGYSPSYNSKYFRPESIDYSLPEEMIREVYILREQKIFIVENQSRIEFHTFINGLKKSNDLITFHINKMNQLVEKKVQVYSENKYRKSMNFAKDFKFILAYIITFIPSLISSGKILFTNKVDKVINSKWLLYTHFISAIVMIVLILFIGIYPQIRLYFFSWSRNVNSKVKRYNKEYKKVSPS
ncbi:MULTISPECIES: hypothetical protein [Bacillus]|nr:hypothetical protein [Bacillus sp. 005/A4HT-01/001]TFW48192.1 hypothetical protein ES896_07670 [Bacillus sp. 005/A4HT-01/001]